VETEGSLPHSQLPVTCPYSEQNRQKLRLKNSSRWTTGKLIDKYNFLIFFISSLPKASGYVVVRFRIRNSRICNSSRTLNYRGFLRPCRKLSKHRTLKVVMRLLPSTTSTAILPISVTVKLTKCPRRVPSEDFLLSTLKLW
jgi:hypothetical protein